MKLLFLFLLLCMHSIGQVPIYFNMNNNDSVIVRVYEITNVNEDIDNEYTFISNDKPIVPIAQKECLIVFEPSNYYLITFNEKNNDNQKNVYVKTENSIKGFPLMIDIDFKNDKTLSIRYNYQKKLYEYVYYKQ